MISLVTNIDSMLAQQNLNVNSQQQSNAIQQLTSGYRINSSANDAAGYGLVSRVFDDEQVGSEARDLATTLAGFSASALALTKQQLYQLDGLSFEDGLRLGADVNAVSRTSPEFRQAIAAFQTDNGLAVTSAVDEPTLATLGLT